MRPYSIIFILLFLSLICYTQEAHYIVRNIAIEESRINNNLLLNRIEIFEGSRIPKNTLQKQLKYNEDLVLNLGTFTDAQFEVLHKEEDSIDLYLHLTETWLLLPVPVFELADDINIWINEYKASIERVNYGLQVYHLNLTGKADRIKILIQSGFTNHYLVEYKNPFINRDHTLGLLMRSEYQTQKSLAINTVDNKHVNYTDESGEQIIKRAFSLGADYRPDIHHTHELRMKYEHNTINKTVSEKNPEYYFDGATTQKFTSLRYSYELFYINRILFPTDGWALRTNINKLGIGISEDLNLLFVDVRAEFYESFNEKWVFATEGSGGYELTNNEIPYSNISTLQSGGVRGYELYVIPAQKFFTLQNTVYRRIWRTSFNINWLPNSFRKINFQMYGGVHLDAGYVSDDQFGQGNSLDEKWLIGSGPVVTLVLFEQFRLDMNISYNRRKELGFYFNVNYGAL